MRKYVQIARENLAGLPVTFSFFVKVVFSKRNREKIKNKEYGVSVSRYNTTAYPTNGHYKPISKIVNLNYLHNLDRNESF